jgi:hypothetical protein
MPSSASPSNWLPRVTAARLRTIGTSTGSSPGSGSGVPDPDLPYGGRRKLVRCPRAVAGAPSVDHRASTAAPRASRRLGAARLGERHAADGRAVRRDPVTMVDTFVDCSWYFLRFHRPGDDSRAFDPREPTGGRRSTSTSAASSTPSLHLLYARFIPPGCCSTSRIRPVASRSALSSARA